MTKQMVADSRRWPAENDEICVLTSQVGAPLFSGLTETKKSGAVSQG